MGVEMVNREAELSRLREAVASPPQLVVVRGRRRVGKSFLLDKVVAGERAVYLQADEQTERAHLDLFAREAARLIRGTPPLRFDDWDAALEFLADQARVAPVAVVLDEFQWLWRAQPALDSIVQRHWDAWQRAALPISLFLSGSALTLMDGLLAPDSPLYGRADYRPLIEPLDFRQAAGFASASAKADEKLRRYAVLGGVPQYQRWAGSGSIATVIGDRILAKGESLYEEPLHLLREERQIRDPGSYFAVVAAIAHGATRPSRIAGVTQLEVPNLTKMLARLADLGYVELREPLGPKREKRSTYRLRDPFFRFWFRYVFPSRSLLERGRADGVLEKAKADLDNFMGPAFEDCCREWLGRYADPAAFPSFDRLGSWWSRDGQTEIDVVAMAGKRYSLVGSCKWDRRADGRVLDRLVEHRERLGTSAAAARLAVFARGFHPRLVERAAAEDAILVSASDLFE